MKTPAQIEEWLKKQPYYEELEACFVKDRLLEGMDPALLLKGEIGVRTMSVAVAFLNPLDYDWDAIEKEFIDWYYGKD